MSEEWWIGVVVAVALTALAVMTWVGCRRDNQEHRERAQHRYGIQFDRWGRARAPWEPVYGLDGNWGRHPVTRRRSSAGTKHR